MSQNQKVAFLETTEKEITSLSENVHNLIHASLYSNDKDEWSSTKESVRLQLFNENMKKSICSLLKLTSDMKAYYLSNS